MVHEGLLFSLVHQPHALYIEVKLMEPNSIARSEGKSKRVIDNRILK